MRHHLQAPQTEKSSGFTIVELMISTLVFSVILLVVTFGIVHFTNSYYRGINGSTTQDTARTIVDSVTQAIQFSSGTITSGTNY
jgi:prepilin-type N-terminal cleavage/methylation domain-containing protein